MTSLLEESDLVLLDGGLATEFERRGFDLRHRLWSAHLLKADLATVKDVHLSYLSAGADVIATASYQASHAGCLAEGMTHEETDELLRRSVQVALEARREFMIQHPDAARPLVAASIGPYGAYLANGDEYTGAYDLSDQALRQFHERRWQVLASSKADLLACETIPNGREVQALIALVRRTSPKPVMISLSCRDARHISDGTPVREVAAWVNAVPEIVALGVNCVAPSLVSSLIEELAVGAPDKYLAVYPNSGEYYDGATRTWQGERDAADFAQMATSWRAKGAKLIGGCCRTTPDHIRQLKSVLCP